MQTQEQIAAENEEVAAMEALFTAQEEIPAGVDVPDVQPGDEGTTTVPEEPEKETAPEPTTFTAEQFQAALEAVKAESKAEISRVHDRVFGKVGELQQRIDSIRATVNLSPKAKDRLAVDFPELAEMLFDSEPIPPQVPPQKQAEPDIDLDAIVTQKVDETRQEYEKRLLEKDHPDWVGTVNSDEFLEWKGATLDAETRATLDNSWDSSFISTKLTEFKAWKAAQAAKQAKAAAKQERLNAAVLPEGVPRGATGGAEKDEEEAAMLEAFGKRNRLR